MNDNIIIEINIRKMIKLILFDERLFSPLCKCVVFYTAISQYEIPNKYDRLRLINKRGFEIRFV